MFNIVKDVICDFCIDSYLELEEVRKKLRNKTISWQEADLLMKPIFKKYAQNCISLNDDNGTKICKKCWTKQLEKFDDFNQVTS